MAVVRQRDIPTLAGIATFVVGCFLGNATLFCVLFATGTLHRLSPSLAAGGLALIVLGAAVVAWGVARALRRRQPAPPLGGAAPWPDQPTAPDQPWPY